MKAITVLEPWASLIVFGPKRVENRSWWTAYRGPLAIHAGKSLRLLGDPETIALAAKFGITRELCRQRAGCLLGRTELLDCVPVAAVRANRWAVGPWCFRLAEPTALATPLAWKGQLGFFDVPDELLQAA